MDEITSELEKIKEEISNQFKAEIIGLFGSYVRGEQKERSDLDILVRFNEGASLFDYIGLADFLEEKLQLKVDVVSERAVRPELKDQILKKVIML
ncbi:MAG: nucleotidyltransferase family protein [Candidatus Heimdallarchaeum endolithica]|uniref:protein adenylyltransferase n=1 Tax=Candidatus Heimdallarchaeum endolithica TaxID=2876572 RepID=A0A9Y1BS81_9ARCH|nr:MAG: nucleotidyltransferase family protein [Candidatus Heimdallarchaeum endolithica]